MRSRITPLLLILPWVTAVACKVDGPEERGEATQEVGTSLGGPAYLEYCRKQGVPVPEVVLDDQWTNHGAVEVPFISRFHVDGSELTAELWSFVSTDPAGICLALPRWFTAGTNQGTAKLFGIICLGKNSSKACFFDNPGGTYFPRGAAQPIANFLGGTELVSNTPDMCTDCHAGENPFVIHPEKKAFVDLRSDETRSELLRPASGWYEPIAPNGWVMNPGPSNQLAGISVPVPDGCVGCHKLPQVSLNLREYCRSVLQPAVTRTWWTPGVGLDETMPRLDQNPGGVTYTDYRERYRPHFGELLKLCGRLAGPSEEIFSVTKDDLRTLSPPTIVEPLYACAQGVAVGNIVPGAMVELTLNGQPAGVARSDGEHLVAFALPQALKANDRLEARQSWGGAISELSQAAVAIDYPDPTLPKPEITPGIIYECATSVGVRTVPGARVELTVNGGPPEVRYLTQGVDAMYPSGAPFKAGDQFQVRAFLCSTPSDPSEVVVASAPPATLRAPRFVPQVPFEGQNVVYLDGLDYGAYASVNHVTTALGLGDTNAFPDGMGSTLFLPSSPLGRSLKVGDVLRAEPHLYCGSIPSTPLTSTPAKPCSTLPAPRILPPIAGARSVVVERAERGARIRVYDAVGFEIADGTGPLLPLVPPRTLRLGESLTVVQQLGTCEGRRAYVTLVEASQE